MAVYVDSMKDYGASGRLSGEWCHMWADTTEELHEMAGLIGMKRQWFQNRPRFPHYDLRKSKRDATVMLGAEEIIGHRAFVAKVDECRVKWGVPPRTQRA